MDDFSNVDPTVLLLSTALQFKHLRKRATISAREESDAQAEREKAFGRHLTENVVCGIRCYPELIFECAKLPTRMEAVGTYNDAVARYEGNHDATLSAKQFRKIANELAKD